ncbi:MAG: alpha/beta hydrolase [Actinomycetia bacterium]|nr:alpha/beta hydrolase [Actinomycetes bacterium]
MSTREPAPVRSDGKPIRIRRFGHGPVLVCVAGGPGRDADYLETLADLHRHRELVIPDQRGTGGSPPPDTNDGYTFDHLAQDLEPVRLHLGLERLPLLAHSAGCTTALYYAALHPHRIQTLLLVAPGRRLYPEISDDNEQIIRSRQHETPIPAALTALEGLNAAPAPEEIPRLLEALTPAFYGQWTSRQHHHAATETLQVNATARQEFNRATINEPALRTRLQQVEAPVLVITGSKDGATGISPGQAWADCFPHGQHLTIPGTGHYPWVDEPQQLRHTVLEFLATI